MLNIEKWKIHLALILTVLGVLYAMPNVLPLAGREWMQSHLAGWMPGSTVNLGLDLRGGSHLLLEADTKAVMDERMAGMEDNARKELRSEDIGYTDLRVKKDGISFRLRDAKKDRDAAYQIVRSLEDGATVDISDDGFVEVILNEAALNDIRGKILNQSIEVVRRRIDESGTKEPLIQRQGDSRIVVQLPGVDDPEHIKMLLGKTAKMTFHLVDMDARPGDVSPTSKQLPVKDGKDGSPGGKIGIKKRVMLTGDMLVDSQPGYDQNSQPVVNFRFNAQGAKRFCEVTRENIGKPFAIVLDDVVVSYPVIRSEICGGQGQISGGFTVKEANDLALLLRAGALPAPLEVVEERSVGPTLGSDSIAAGKIAAAVAVIVVFTLMAMIYGIFGVFADIALMFNIIFIFAILSILQATLTLPGIAGIILTIGIAVDANVLIYERIREELRQGRTTLSAVDTGYRLALNTIIDANLTTLIVAMILFTFGSGPIKGFAVSMCIGIITSMFSAIMLTRIMVVTWIKQKRPAALAI